MELKPFALSIRQSAQIQEMIMKGRMIMPTLSSRLTWIPTGALQFELEEIY